MIFIGLVYDPLLSSLGYALNEDVKAVICTGCHRGVPVDMLGSHSKRHHPGRVLPSSDDLEAIDGLAVQGYLSSKAEKYHQPPGQKPVDGLEVLEGFRCRLPGNNGSECSRAFVAVSTFTRHLSDHPKLRGSASDSSSCASYVQTLFSQGGLQNYFSVDPSLSTLDPSTASEYAYALKMLQSLPKAEIPASDYDKDQASIHWFTRWPELLKPYAAEQRDIGFLMSLVIFPEPSAAPEWFTKLQDHGSRWWKKAESAHINCSFRASVMLRSHQE